jgi:hypothetical protein
MVKSFSRLLASALWIVNAGNALASVTLRPAQLITADCRVHTLTEDGLESLHPCGKSLSLPANARTLWIEQGDAISGQIEMPLASNDIELPLVPAGEVSLVREPSTKWVRIVHAGSTRFAREIASNIAGRRIRLPAGATVGLFFDESADVAGIARATLAKGPTVLVSEAVRGADVVGLFTVPTTATADSDRFLIDANRPADLVIDRGNEIIALWRNLAPGPADLTLESRTWQLAAVPLRLRERKIETIRGELRRLPHLTVTVDIPEESKSQWQALEPTFTLRRAADKKTVRQVPATTSHEFSLLPVDTYEIVLNSKPWTFVRRADLSSGEDTSVEFALKPFTITGQVTIGNEPAAANVTFRRGGGDLDTVRTDADGNYEITLWAGGMYLVEATLDEAVSELPYTKLIRLWTSRELDVHVPRTDVVVLVTDAATNKPVPNAQVGVMNTWTDPASGRTGGSHNATTNSSGRARLAPMNSGTAEIYVTADGYFNPDPLTVPVEENGVERLVEIKLRPADAGTTVRIVLPNGGPAANAEILVVGDTAGLRTLWSGRADERGHVGVPKALEQSIVLVRHPAAAGLARRFQNLPDQEYRLPALSPYGLFVRVERDGAPATYGAITVWFDGLPLTLSALQFVVRVPPNVQANGTWNCQSLPVGPVRILVSSGSVDAAIAAGAYDALATTIPEPRPNQVVLRSVD